MKISSTLPAIALSALVACSAPAPTVRTQVARRGGSSPIATQLLHTVNDYRVRNGAAPLQSHPALERLAIEHSEYLRQHRGSFSIYGKNVSHFGSEARAFTAIQLLGMADYSENVAATHSQDSPANTARVLVILWQRSQGHEPVMRKQTWTHTGIGIVTDADGTVFATQVFGTVTGSIAGHTTFRPF